MIGEQVSCVISETRSIKETEYISASRQFKVRVKFVCVYIYIQ